MQAEALRLLARRWGRRSRSAVLMLCAGFAFPVAAQAQEITAAEFAAPTERYAHAVLGDAIEWGALRMTLSDGRKVTVTLPQDHVFEDVAPRLLDVTGDSAPEVVVVETDMAQGAALAIYTAQGKLAQTPHIGQTNRWLAPVGAADLDGDGYIEIAYIDRPHLAKTLRVWRFRDGALTQIAALRGLTNHRIGERDIAGGIRACGGVPEMIMAQGDWGRVVSVRFEKGALIARDEGPHNDRSSFTQALRCP